ncbi:MAG TPA: hypothetical protein VLK82_20305 [Candidatus Tectomicrobia bacterium]|nr:hypothetical protein [Candidatus Tectomicrobia bacterium]
MSEALNRATRSIGEVDLPRMVLALDELPAEFHGFHPSHDGILDNATMAEQGFPGNSAESFAALGRMTGYVREFAAPVPRGEVIPIGYDLAVATVVHLFEDMHGVARWMQEVFLGQFEANAGQEIHPNQHLLVVERLPFQGFSDTVAGLRVLQSGPQGPVSSTVVDFRVGRLLGVVYIAAFGNCERRALVERLGHALERKIVRVVLGDL